jgi:tetratricopeptide (TPR) repeat protein
MRKMVQLSLLAMLVALAGCGKDNIFSWAHKAGGNSSTNALLSDANTALTNKDYDKALEYYLKIIESDPENAEAIYGYSAATLADAGLDIASLISNLIKDQAGAPSQLAPAIAYAARSGSNDTNILPQSIIDKLPTIKAAIDKILAEGKLPKIVKGGADGSINPDNPDVNLNLAFCLVLRAALHAQECGAVQIDSDYGVTFNNPSTVDAQAIGEDIVSAYQRLLVVIEKLNLGNDGTIVEIKDNVEDLYEQYKRDMPSGVNLDLHYDYLLGRSGK